MAAKKATAKKVPSGRSTKKKRVAVAKAGNGAAELKAIRQKQTKTQIITAIAEDTGLTRTQVSAVLGSLGTLAKRHVKPRGSGEFSIPEMGLKVRRVHRKARTARNPMTGEPVRVAAKTVVRATVLKAMKEVVA